MDPTQSKGQRASEPENEADLPPDYRHNFVAGIIHGVFFQASAALSSIHTVLPAFVALLTPSTYAVGLMASVQGLGEVAPQLFTAYLIEDRPRKKPLLLAIITLRWASWALIAVLTYLYGQTHPQLVLIVLLTLFSVFSVAGGAGTVVYADIFSKAIPALRRGRFAGWRQLLGYVAAIGAGVVVRKLLQEDQSPDYPNDYAIIFGLTSLSLLVAFTGFALIREPVQPVKRVSTSMRQLLVTAMGLARSNPNFRRSLWARGLTDAVLALAPFYVVYALSDRGVGGAMIGTFLLAQMAGGALSNVLWGWLGDHYGNRAVIVGTSVTGLITPAAALLASRHDLAFLVVFASLGATMSGLKLGYANLILEMAEAELRPTCVALQNTILLPVTLIPLLVAGLVVVVPYSVMFAIGVVVMVVALAVSYSVIDPRRDPAGGCIQQTVSSGGR